MKLISDSASNLYMLRIPRFFLQASFMSGAGMAAEGFINDVPFGAH